MPIQNRDFRPDLLVPTRCRPVAVSFPEDEALHRPAQLSRSTVAGMTKRVRTVVASLAWVGCCVTAVLLASSAAAQTPEPGRQVFASRCADVPRDRRAAAASWARRFSARIPLRSDAELEAVIREGLPGAGMPAFPNLSKAEARDLVAFLRTLRAARRHGPAADDRDARERPHRSPASCSTRADGEMQLLGDDRARAPAARGDRRPLSRGDVADRLDDLQRPRQRQPLQRARRRSRRPTSSRLAPKWVFTLPNAAQLQVTPVVVDGVMYVTAANDLYALDAGSGRQIWNYRRPRTRGLVGVAARGVNRGVAVAGDRVFMTTDHAHLIALNRATGALLWETDDGRLAPELQRHRRAARRRTTW